MWYEIFRFELYYRFRRADTYIYFVILFFSSLFAIDFIYAGSFGKINENAPFIITYSMAVTTALLLMITSMIMGVAAIRDFSHNMESLMFVNPISKRAYLLGRFSGSFAVLVFIFMGLLSGFMLSYHLPWRDVEHLAAFNIWHYVQPFLYIVLPNVFFAGSLFFVSGALGRKLIIVYTQGIVLLVAYLAALILSENIENEIITSLLDPFTLNAIGTVTNHWTAIDRNAMLLPVEGVLLANRLLWTGAGLLALVIGYKGFSFNVVRNSAIKKPAGNIDAEKYEWNPGQVPDVKEVSGLRSKFGQLAHHAVFYFRSITREIPFWAILICGAAIIFLNGISLGTTFGVSSYPTTYLIVEELQELSIWFFLMILIFYSGELIWKERDVKMNLVYDALPTTDLMNLSAKFSGIMLTYAAMMGVLMLSGVVFQTLNGFYEYNIPVYLYGFFLELLPFLGLYTLLSLFIQVLVNHKFLGHLTTLMVFILTLAMGIIGLDHDLIRFGGDVLGTYSEMNGYGHFLSPYLWVQIYWFAFCGLLLFIAALYVVRGTETNFKTRLKMSKQRLNKPLLRFGLISIVFFACSGGYIFYNTNILNSYISQDTEEQIRANYEKALKKYESQPQPKVVAVNLDVALYPKERDYSAEGYYVLVNKGEKALSEIHLQKYPSDHITLERVKFEEETVLNDEYEQFGYYIYELQKSLAPGDSIKLEFKQLYKTSGFVEGESDTRIVYNGTFLNNDYFPSLGYNRLVELRDEDDREKYGLPPREQIKKRNDSVGLLLARTGDDGYEINFEITVSTDSSQIAVAPGNLVQEWTEGSRTYFHYRMDKPMINFYSIVSARYKVLKDQWTSSKDSTQQPVALEIYYHEGHEYNLDRMMRSMKASLDYYTEEFGPYAYKQMRIMEYPRYRSFAQSYPGAVPFSESIGFMMDMDDEEDVDMSFYVTAHELAHQWWGLQVVAANVEGRHMILESLAQYSALMVMKHNFSEEKVHQFLKRQHDKYLEGRTSKTAGERPLSKTYSQEYVHYSKGAINLYAFQDYITEDSVNMALKRFVDDWNAFGDSFQKERYATSKDLLRYFRAITPDSLQYIIEDLFKTITFYDLKISSAEYEILPDGKYEVNLSVEARKYRADSLGIETEIEVNDWIDVGIYARGENGKEKLVYLKKHKVTDPLTHLKIVVGHAPLKAGIDPKHKLIDLNSEDNITAVNSR